MKPLLKIMFFLLICPSTSLKAYEDKLNVLKDLNCSNWLKGADAAITFTWDDPNPNHSTVADIIEEYGFYGSFFVYPGRHDWYLHKHESESTVIL